MEEGQTTPASSTQRDGAAYFMHTDSGDGVESNCDRWRVKATGDDGEGGKGDRWRWGKS